MLIFDSHADTLYAMQDIARGPGVPLDITRERLRGAEDVRVQTLAPSGPEIVLYRLRPGESCVMAGAATRAPAIARPRRAGRAVRPSH